MLEAQLPRESCVDVDDSVHTLKTQCEHWALRAKARHSVQALGTPYTARDRGRANTQGLGPSEQQDASVGWQSNQEFMPRLRVQTSGANTAEPEGLASGSARLGCVAASTC